METLLAVNNPFPGLRPFGTADQEFFFGREQEIDELINRLSVRRFLAVLGVSGCGKSSLIYAGLIPVLCSGLAQPLTGEWRVYTFWPGDDPLKSLQNAIDAELPNQSHALLSWAKAQDQSENILIFVDQFEEIFSYREKTLSQDGGNKASLFIDLLLTAAVDPAVPLYIVLTMRTDYLGVAPVFRGLSEALNEGSYLVPRLSRLRQQEAIERPAAVLGTRLQPGLVQRLLNDSEGDPDKLPVLQHLLKVLWERRSKELDLKLYETVGGWQHAIENDAESVLAQFPAELTGIQHMFQWMADPGTVGKPVRRRVPLRELSEVSGLSPERVKTILHAFADRGFIRFDLGEQTLVDFTHESVMWQWPKLQQWIAEEGEQAARIRFLQQAAEQKQWITGLTLKNAQALMERIKSSPTWISRYVTDPKKLDELAYWVSKSRKDADAGQKREKRLRYLIACLVLGLLAASTILAVTFLINYQSAQGNNQRLNKLNYELNIAQSALRDANDKLGTALQATNQDRQGSTSAKLAKKSLETLNEKQVSYGATTIQYFAKQSELRDNPELVPAWKQLGFNIQIMTPKFELPSNTIWYGSQVSRSAVQAAAYCLLINGFALRQIKSLKESNLDQGRERVIQVGWSNQADSLRLLSVSDIQELTLK